jgi:hypothetical protein
MRGLSRKKHFLNAKFAKNFRRGRKGNNVGDMNFAPPAVFLRPLRLNSIPKKNISFVGIYEKYVSLRSEIYGMSKYKVLKIFNLMIFINPKPDFGFGKIPGKRAISVQKIRQTE